MTTAPPDLDAVADALADLFALDVVDAVGNGARSFMGSKVANQVSPTTRDGPPPVPGVVDKGVLFRRIDLVADHASQHGIAPLVRMPKT